MEIASGIEGVATITTGAWRIERSRGSRRVVPARPKPEMEDPPPAGVEWRAQGHAQRVIHIKEGNGADVLATTMGE